MSSQIALLRGSSVSLYSHMANDLVLLMKDGYKYFTTRLRTFNELYYELSGNVAALKEDCIEYTVYERERDFLDYPDWFITAYDNGYIYTHDDHSDYCMYNETGDIGFDPGGIVLCNFLGQVTYMQPWHFERHYETNFDKHFNEYIGGLSK